MKKLAILIASLAFVACSSVASAAGPKVGILNVQEVLQNSNQVKTLQADLKKQFAPDEKKMEKAGKTLKDDVDKYNRDSSVMKKDKQQEMQQKIIKEQQDLQKMNADFQQRFSAAQQEGMHSVLQNVNKSVEKIAKAKKLDLVVVKAGVAYASDSIVDVTADVIKDINK